MKSSDFLSDPDYSMVNQGNQGKDQNGGDN